MPDRCVELQRKWKDAIDCVSSAEAVLAAAWSAFGAGTGPAPDKALITEVQRLRLECDTRLAEILDGFEAAALDESDGPGESDCKTENPRVDASSPQAISIEAPRQP